MSHEPTLPRAAYAAGQAFQKADRLEGNVYHRHPPAPDRRRRTISKLLTLNSLLKYPDKSPPIRGNFPPVRTFGRLRRGWRRGRLWLQGLAGGAPHWQGLRGHRGRTAARQRRPAPLRRHCQGRSQ